MTLTCTDTLAEAVVETLEVMAFIIAERTAELPEGAAPFVRVEIRYDGSAKGMIELACPRAFGAMLAANVGFDDVAPETAAAPALLELSNVVCGSYLRKVTQGAGNITIGLPISSELTAQEWSQFAALDGTLALNADNFPLLIRAQ